MLATVYTSVILLNQALGGIPLAFGITIKDKPFGCSATVTVIIIAAKVCDEKLLLIDNFT